MRTISLLMIMAMCFSCKENTNNVIKNLHWLKGKWKNKDQSGHEYWEESEKGLKGYSVGIENNDTIFFEELRIEECEKTLCYIVNINHSKDTSRFELVNYSDNIAVFENSKHDFPQRIIYMKQVDGSLHARIEGEDQGKKHGVDFFMQPEP